MKRSTQVSLVLMTAAGIGAGAYALTPNGSCRQPPPSTNPGNPQGPAPPASAPDCRSSHGGSSGGGSSFSSSGSRGSGSPGATTSAGSATPESASASRGGFGSIGHALASFAGG